MSCRGVDAASEGINSIARGGRANVGVESVAAYNINGAVEQPCDVILKRDIFKDANRRCRIDFDHDVDVAVRPVVAASARAEQRRVTDAARATPLRSPAAWR